MQHQRSHSLLLFPILLLILSISIQLSNAVDIKITLRTCQITRMRSSPSDYKKLFQFATNNKRKASKVQTLKIVNSNLPRLPAFLQRVFPNVRALHIDEIGLETLESRDIAGFKKLNKITAADNHLESLSADLFDENGKIESVNLNNNRISDIDAGSIVANENLHTLKLKDNACINRLFHLRTAREKAEASRIILKKCMPKTYVIDMKKRRCFLTAMMVGSYINALDKKDAKKKEKQRKREEEERARQVRFVLCVLLILIFQIKCKQTNF